MEEFVINAILAKFFVLGYSRLFALSFLAMFLAKKFNWSSKWLFLAIYLCVAGIFLWEVLPLVFSGFIDPEKFLKATLVNVWELSFISILLYFFTRGLMK